MKFIELTSFGEPDVLHLGHCLEPVAGVGELLIRVSASGVNRPDVLQRKGLYPAPAGASPVLGLEVAGTVVAGDVIAMQAAHIQLGDRVCALVNGGGYAQYCVAPVGQCLPIPSGLSDVEAASLPETLFTVWSNVFERARLQAGEYLLVHGGGSGIGVMAIQLAKAFGAFVITTAGSDEKCAACLALGAYYAINYKTQDFQSEVLRLTADRGVDVVLDMVAGDYIGKELACMAEDGRVVVIAVQGGVHSEINAALVMRKRLTVTGSTLRPRSLAFKAAIAQECLKRVWPLLEAGTIKPVVHSVFLAVDEGHVSGSGASRAHALMESNQHVGKIVMNWDVA